MLLFIGGNIFAVNSNTTAAVYSATSAGESRYSNLPLHSALHNTPRRSIPLNVKKRQTVVLERSSSSVHSVYFQTCNFTGVP